MLIGCMCLVGVWWCQDMYNDVTVLGNIVSVWC